MEIFKDVPGYEGLYQVSNMGRVKSLGNNETRKDKILKNCLDRLGYSHISLCNDSKIKKYSTHQLVAMAFLNHNPCGHKLVIDHINDVKNDNRLENLQLITQRDNCYKTQGKYSSKYKGVCWDKARNKWHAKITINKKKMFLGYFEKEYDASVAYQNKLLSLSN
jgi:hypothetical protein